MENIAGVTGFLKKKIIARGGDPERETLNIIPTVDNKPYYRDTNGGLLAVVPVYHRGEQL